MSGDHECEKILSSDVEYRGTAFEESNGNLETYLPDSRIFNLLENPDHAKFSVGPACA